MSDIRGLDAWMRKLADQDLPTLDSVVKDICELSEEEDCRTEDLTKIILRDADLTSKVLKVSNSIHYNRSFSPIRTVSRAVVQLGFDNLKNITLATTLIDNFLKGKPKELLIQRLAKSFHAAVQAKALVPYLDGEHKEQVFIAALLRNIGELALLASGNAAAEQFITARDLHPEQEQTISRDYLGVEIDQINKALIKEWSLGELVREASEDSLQPNNMVRAINIGNDLSKYIHKGINSPEMARIYAQVSQLCSISIESAKKHVTQMAGEASVIAKSYGADVLLRALPNPNAVEDAAPEAAPIAAPAARSGYELQQLMNYTLKFMLEGGDLSKIMQFSVVALHEGSAIARVTIAMIDYKTKCMDARYVAGKNTHLWQQQVRIELDKLHKDELLYDFLKVQQPIWYQSIQSARALGALTALNQAGDMMLSALKIDKRLVAVLYADNAGASLSPRQYEDFQLISNQLNLMLKVNASQASTR